MKAFSVEATYDISTLQCFIAQLLSLYEHDQSLALSPLKLAQ